MSKFNSFEEFADDTKRKITSFCDYSAKYLSRFDGIVLLVGRAMKEKGVIYSPQLALEWVENYLSTQGYKKNAKQRYYRVVNLLNSNWQKDLDEWRIYPSVFRLCPTNSLFLESAEAFEKYLRNEAYSPKTVYTRMYSANQFLHWLETEGYEDFNELHPAVVSRYLCADHFQNRKPGGVSTEIIGLRKFLVFLEDQEIIAENCSKACFSKPNKSKRIVTIYTDEQVLGLLKPLDNSKANLRNKAIFLLALKCGLRSCDIMNLKFGNIDFENKMIKLTQSKTGEGLYIPFDNEVSNALIEYILYERSETESPFVFLTVQGPSRKLSHSTSFRTQPHFKDGELPLSGGLHILRRTYASRLLSCDIDVSSIARVLGHTSLDSVDRYLSTDEQKMKRCALSIERYQYEGGLL